MHHANDTAAIQFAMALWFIAIILWAFAPWLGKAFGDPTASTPGLFVWPPWAVPPDYIEFNAKVGAVMAFVAGGLFLAWYWSSVVRVFTG